MGMWSGGGSKYGYRSGAYRGDFTVTHGLILGALFAIPTFGLSLLLFPLLGIKDSINNYPYELTLGSSKSPQIPQKSSQTLYYRGKPYTR